MDEGAFVRTRVGQIGGVILSDGKTLKTTPAAERHKSMGRWEGGVHLLPQHANVRNTPTAWHCRHDFNKNPAPNYESLDVQKCKKKRCISQLYLVKRIAFGRPPTPVTTESD